MKSLIRRYPFASWLVGFYALVWLISVPGLLGREGFGVLPIDVPPQVGILVGSLFGLTGLGLLVTRIADGKEAFRGLLRHYYRFLVGPQWYVLAILLVPALMFAAAVLLHGPSALGTLGPNFSLIFSGFGASLLFSAVVINFWEEGGWMGFATARLQRRWGPVAASAIVAPFFGAQHFVLFLFPGAFLSPHPTLSEVAVAVFVLLVGLSIPWRIIITFFYNSTGGSIPVVAVLHASLDAIGSGVVFGTFFPGLDLVPLYAALWIVAAVLIAVTRGRLGYRSEAVEATKMPAISAAANA